MSFIDYYKILEIDKKATDKDIKKAYRKLARKYHPDVNPNDDSAKIKFQGINEANEVLSDPDKRAKYDKYGKDWQHADEFEKQKQQQQHSRGSQHTGQADFDGGDFSSFFESMFGSASSQGAGGRTVKFKGQDYHAELNLDLRDVYETHKQTLTVNGKNIRLTIPAGVKNGQVIKIKGHGGQGINNGPKGDLYIKFNLSNNTPFKRDNENLFKHVDLDLYTAILGGEITVDTFNGKAKLKVKPHTQNGTKVKLKGKGFPKYKKKDQFGDLYITYEILIPAKLSKKEKELFEELAKLKSHGK